MKLMALLREADIVELINLAARANYLFYNCPQNALREAFRKQRSVDKAVNSYTFQVLIVSSMGDILQCCWVWERDKDLSTIRGTVKKLPGHTEH